MKYCLLIHISRSFISFLYNKEGDKGFVPYGEEPVKPLAVYCQGNEISIGKFALAEAQKGNKHAHSNLFDAISSTELIEYKGQRHDINKLLFFAMEKYVAEFFDKILMRSEGTLEDNRAHFPVALLFNPDLRLYERDYVVKSMVGGGYGNLLSVNASHLFENIVCSKMGSETVPIFVGGDGYNLYCESEKARFSEIVTMEKVAIDPRIDRAVRIIWRDILHQGYDEYRSDKTRDASTLRKKAADFLNSTKREQMFTVLLSDGITYDSFLKRSDFGMSGAISDDAMAAFARLSTQIEASGAQTAQCCIVLTDREVAGEHVERLFRHYFPNVIGISDEQRYRALLALSDMVTAMGYVFRNAAGSEADKAFTAGKFTEARDMYKAMSTAAAEGKVADCTACIRDERRIREFLSLPTEAQARERDGILDIFTRWKEMGVGEEHINSRRERVDKRPPLPPPPQLPPPQATVDEKTFRREYREVMAQAKGYIRERKANEAIRELTAFITQYKDKGMDLSEAEKVLAENSTAPPTTPQPSQQPPSEGEQLMKASKLKEARDWFAAAGLTSEARDCTTLIKAARYLKAYKAEMPSIKNNRNLQVAKSYLHDMESWRTVYARHGLDTKGIDETINSYKSIK